MRAQVGSAQCANTQAAFAPGSEHARCLASTKLSLAHLLGSFLSQVFAAVPFLYELRELLDWSCTPTTLP